MGEYQYVKVSVEERIAILTIDHPPANAFDTRTVMDLNAAFDEVLANPEVKAIIITGAGQFAFVAGADINEINALKGHDDAKEVVVKGQQLFSKIEASPKPVIAAINAVCLGRRQRAWPWPATIRHRLGPRSLRPARNQPGHHPRLGRHPAPAALRRQGQGL